MHYKLYFPPFPCAAQSTSSSLVVSSSSGACIDIGTGLTMPTSSYLLKAPYPVAGSSYNKSTTIVISPLTTLASYVLSVGGLANATVAFSRVAKAHGLGSSIDLST